MSKFVRNPEGAIHSVPDDWQVPLGADDNPQEGWAVVDEAEAPATLIGSTTGEQLDPQVVANDLHDLSAVDDPNQIAAPGIPDVASSGHVGDDPQVSEDVEAAQVPAQAGNEEAAQ